MHTEAINAWSATYCVFGQILLLVPYRSSEDYMFARFHLSVCTNEWTLIVYFKFPKFTHNKVYSIKIA